MSGPARSCRCAGSRMLCVASYRSAWRRRAELTSAFTRKANTGIQAGSGGWFATDFALNRNDTPYVIAQRLHCPLNRLSTLSHRHIEIISNDLFFALKLEPISHFPGMNHLLLARDAGMRLERP